MKIKGLSWIDEFGKFEHCSSFEKFVKGRNSAQQSVKRPCGYLEDEMLFG